MREIRAQLSPSEDGKIKGYAALFDSWSLPISERGRTFRERIKRGALKPDGSVSLWWMHDHTDPLANTKSGTLVITEDAKGVAFEADLGAGARADEIRDLVRRGVVAEMSIGFVVEADAWEGATSRTVTRARLHEVSLVENAAYPGTYAEVRKEHKMGLKENRARLVELRAEYPNAADERQLEILEQINEVEEAIASERTAMESRLKAPAVIAAAAPSIRSAAPQKTVRDWFRGGYRAERAITLAVAGQTTMGADATMPQLSGEFIKALDQESVMRQLATVETRGVDTDVTVISNSTRITAALVSEGGAYGSSDFDTSKVSFTAYKSGMYTDVSEEALQDTVWDLATQVVQEHGRGHGRLWETYYATGTGSSQPRGVFHSGTNYTGRNNTAAGAPTIDDLIQMAYTLNPAYQASSAWLMHQSTWASIVKNTASGKYMLNGENANILRDGAVALLLGRPVYLSEFAPAVSTTTAGTRHVLFGDFKRGYRIVDRASITFTVDDLTQATSGYVRYVSRMRSDAKPVDVKAVVATVAV